MCNKSALFDDLQIDSYTESILHSLDNENITEISIDSHLNWKPVNVASGVLAVQQQYTASDAPDIVLDDDPMDDSDGDRKPLPHNVDCKSHIHLLTSATKEPSDIILIDDD